MVNIPSNDHLLWRKLHGLGEDTGPWTELECYEWHLADRIRHQAWLAQDNGYMKRLRSIYPSTVLMVDDIIKAQDKEYWRIDIEIDRLREKIDAIKSSVTKP